jgi:hypothetical protein
MYSNLPHRYLKLVEILVTQNWSMSEAGMRWLCQSLQKRLTFKRNLIELKNGNLLIIYSPAYDMLSTP